MKSVRLDEEVSGWVVGEPRVVGGPNRSLELRGDVFVGVEIGDEDKPTVPVDVTGSQSVTRMAGYCCDDGSGSSPSNRPESCPTT